MHRGEFKKYLSLGFTVVIFVMILSYMDQRATLYLWHYDGPELESVCDLLTVQF